MKKGGLKAIGLTGGIGSGKSTVSAYLLSKGHHVIDADKMAKIYSDLHQNIQDVFNEAGIELLSPHYQAHRDGSQSMIPPSYLPPKKN